MTEQTTEARPAFKPCAKCEALQDVALLCGPCADRFADRLMAEPAFAAALATADMIDRALARYLGSTPPHAK